MKQDCLSNKLEMWQTNFKRIQGNSGVFVITYNFNQLYFNLNLNLVVFVEKKMIRIWVLEECIVRECSNII